MRAMLLLSALCLARPIQAESSSVHFQSTVIDQGHFRFHSAYAGRNSQQPLTESDTSVTSTLFLGWRPFSGTELYLDPELSGGQGMSGALGIAGFPNGETARIGNPRPVVKTARLYLQQTIPLGAKTQAVDDGPNQVAGKVPEERLTVWAGKFGLMDFFDNNAYSHDPRSQFMNWSLVDSAAWDYPADTFGYTWGLAAEWRRSAWAVRGAAAAEPKQANQADMDRRIGRAHGFVLEGEHQSPWEEHKGAFRLLVYLNEANMGDYDQAVALAKLNAVSPDITQARAYGHSKLGLASSDDLQLAKHLGVFARLSWDDGRSETWAFDEVDASAAFGLDWVPAAWGRPNDHWGIAQIVNALSGPHRRYLTNGGQGFMLGDGALHYAPELDWETYYRIQARDWLQVSPDMQFVANPGYNRTRGPVWVWAVRAHVQL